LFFIYRYSNRSYKTGKRSTQS